MALWSAVPLRAGKGLSAPVVTKRERRLARPDYKEVSAERLLLKATLAPAEFEWPTPSNFFPSRCRKTVPPAYRTLSI